MDKLKFAVIGAGAGGQTMAAYLASQNYYVTLYDHDKAKIARLNESADFVHHIPVVLLCQPVLGLLQQLRCNQKASQPFKLRQRLLIFALIEKHTGRCQRPQLCHIALNEGWHTLKQVRCFFKVITLQACHRPVALI